MTMLAVCAHPIARTLLIVVALLPTVTIGQDSADVTTPAAQCTATGPSLPGCSSEWDVVRDWYGSRSTLAEHGITGRKSDRGEILLDSPDGIEIGLQDVSYCACT